VKRRTLIGELAELAQRQGVEFLLRRHGGRHDVYRFGQLTVVVPRHREIDERTARGIFRDCEREGDERR
jgi:hypothetical protein